MPLPSCCYSARRTCLARWIDRSFPLLVDINSEYRLSLAQGGLGSTIFTVNVVLFAALSGWFKGRFGRRRVGARPDWGLGLLGRLRRSGTCPGKKVASGMILLGEA